jgi:DNA-binding response OmpR family regulator
MSDDATPPPDAGRTLDRAIAAMRERYIETSRGTVRTLELLGERLADAPDSPDLVVTLRRELHRVHGTAGSLGFHSAGRVAGAMEGVARAWGDDPSLDRDRRSTIVLNLSRALRESIAEQAGAPQPGHRLLLLGLPDAVAVRLVAEGTYRAFSVERMEGGESAAAVDAAAPWGVVALDTATPPSEGSGVARVHLHEPTATTAAPAPAGIRVVDLGTDAREIIDILEHLARHEGIAGGTVLLVDDSPVVLTLLRAFSERAGLQVETASDGNDFIARLDRVLPSIVVLDIDLADLNGIDLLRAIRASPVHRSLPVLMLTSHRSASTRAAAFDAGADDYMIKPVVPAEFTRRITQLVEVRRQQRVAGGLHPASGLPLPARTAQELEARLDGRGDADWSVGLIRAARAPETTDEIAAWQRECARVASAVRADGGVAGLQDEPALAIVLPVPPTEMVAMLTALAGGVPAHGPEWSGGAVSTRLPGLSSLRSMLDAATDACLAARESGVPARAWNPADADIAPDVIVVEDDTSLTDMLTFALVARGLSHRVYHNGPDALEALRRLKVHDHHPIVLLDVDLPGMDGHSLHERLRVERPGAYRVVFMSAHTSESDQLRALQGGALDYLVKPVSLRVLMAKLTVWRDRAGSA